MRIHDVPFSFLAASCLVLVTTRPLAAQLTKNEEGLIVIKRQPKKLQGLELGRLDAALELFAQRSVDKRDPLIGSSTEDVEDIFRQTLELSADATIGHENLLDLTGVLRFRFEETYLDSDTQSINDEDFSFENLYNIRGLILKKSDLPTTVYSSRNQSLLDRQFAGSLDSVTLEHGISTRIQSVMIPLHISYFHREQDQTTQLGGVDFRLVQDSAAVRIDSRAGPMGKVNLDYTIENIEESGAFRTGSDFLRQDLVGIHKLDFGLDDLSNIRSTIRLHDRQGDISDQQARLEEKLWLHHSTTLDTVYDFSYEDREQSGLDTTMWTGNASVRHRLFDSVFTVINVGGSTSKFGSQSTSEQYYGDANISYTKRVPYGGIDADVNYGQTRQRDGQRRSLVQVFNEPHTFLDPAPIVIRRQTIVASSIVVSDAADVRVYIEGVDYDAFIFADRVEIRRLIGGAIANGEDVLIDYEIGPQPGRRADTDTVSLALRYNIQEGPLSGMGFYVRYRDLNQELITEQEGFFVPDDSQSLVYGVDYYYDGISFSAEREHLRNEISPFDAIRLEALYQYRINRGSVLSLDGKYNTVEFLDDDNKSDVAFLTARWSHSLSPSLWMDLDCTYRDEHDRLIGTSTGFEQGLSMRWRRGRTDMTFSARNAVLDRQADTDTFQNLSFTIRRSF